MDISIDFEGVNWNATHWAKKTEEEFKREQLENKTYGKYPPEDEKKLIAEAFKQIKAAVGTPVANKPNPVSKGKAEAGPASEGKPQ